MSLLRPEPSTSLNWRLIAILVVAPLILWPLSLLIPDDPPRWVYWITVPLGFAIDIGIAAVLVWRIGGGAAMIHGFAVGAFANALPAVLRLGWTIIKGGESFQSIVLGIAVLFLPVVFAGLKLAAFVWIVEKLRDWYVSRPSHSAPA